MAPQRDVSFTIRAKDEASAAIKETKKALGELKDVAKDMAAGIAAALGAVGLAEFFRQSLTAAAEAEAAWSRMAVAVQNAGGEFESFRPEAERVIDLLSGKTKGMFEKDSMAAALEKLVEVSGDAKGSLGALPVVLDLARAKHMDLEQAATVVGRVMGGNTSMLRRYGIVVDETSDAMAQLADKFQGFAAADATTMMGTLDRLTVAWAEFQQAVGKALAAPAEEAGEGLLGFLVRLERGITANEAAAAHMLKPFRDITAFFGGVFAATLKAVGSGLATLWISAEGLTSGLVIGVAKLAEGLGRLVQLVPALRDVGKEIKAWGEATGMAAKDDLSSKWKAYVGMYDGANTGGGASPATGALPGVPKAALTKADESAVRSLADAIRHLGDETADGKTKAQQFAEKMDEIRRKMEVTKGVTQAMRDDFARLNDVLQRIKDAESADAFRQLSESILDVTGDAVSKATAEMSKKLEELRKARDKVTDPAKLAAYDAEVERLNGLYGVQLNTLKLIEESQRVSGDAARSGSGPESLIAQRGRIGSALATEEALHGRTTDAAKKLRAEYDRLTESILGMHNSAVDGAAALASGILSAGNSLGIFDQKTQAMLGSVISLTSEMAKLAQLSKGDLFNISKSGAGWGAAIAAAGSLLGAMFGTSPEVARALQVQMQNTEALQKLSDTLHATGLNVTGRDLSAAQSQLSKLGAFRSPIFGEPATDLTKTGLAEFFKANGLDSTLLHSVASALGITIDDTLGSYRRLAEAVEIASGRVAKFGDSFADLSTEYDAYARIFNVTDPRELLKLRARAGAESSSTIAGILGGADLSSQAGLAALLAKVQGTFTQLMNGGAGIDLGGLTRDQFIAVLTQLSTDITGLTGAVQEQTRAIYGVPMGARISLEAYRAARTVVIPASGGVGAPSSGGAVASGGTTSGASATPDVTIHNTIVLDNKVVARSVVRTLEQASARVTGSPTYGTVPSGAI